MLKAENELEEEELEKVSTLAKKMLRGRFNSKSLLRKTLINSEPKELTPDSLRRRSRQKRLTLEEQIDVVWRVQSQMESWKDVAQHHRVSLAQVSLLMGKVKRNPELLSGFLEKQ